LREVREEVGLELTDLSFLCSFANEYLFAEVTYPVLDLFFTAHTTGEVACAAEEVDTFSWVDPRTVAPGDMAFPSMQRALAFWQQQGAVSQ
jgi:8-oxo-dGTP pyrophosphatase MutT (NUDIX family)